ncbi:MAG: hypothetical protein LBM99_03425 [Bacillales bacterium]|nr:hypothetical protein [Bacillales bacterium]
MTSKEKIIIVTRYIIQVLLILFYLAFIGFSIWAIFIARGILNWLFISLISVPTIVFPISIIILIIYSFTYRIVDTPKYSLKVSKINKIDKIAGLSFFLVVFIFGISAFVVDKDNKTFTPEKWANASASQKGDMYKDFSKKYNIIDMSENEILLLLGQPNVYIIKEDYYREDIEFVYRYYVEFYYMDDNVYDIMFNADKLVIDFDI